MDAIIMIKVLNRDNGSVVYSIPELNGLRRVFQAGEIKQVPFDQLLKLSYIPGGRELLQDSLVILDNKQAIKELLGEVEIEYNYTPEDIIKLMRDGSLDEFLDCLDFAPQGVKDLIKLYAVQLPLNDVSKREAIFNKLGFNVDNAIKIAAAAEPLEEKSELHQRRVSKNTKQQTAPIEKKTVRRVVKNN